jgi:hypothetical protein
VVHRSCDLCKYNRQGRCFDSVLYGPQGFDLITDHLPRLCYESRVPDADKNRS